MIEINVIHHDLSLGAHRAVSIATVTVTPDGRVTAWSQKTRVQSLVESWDFTTDHELWRQIAEIATSIYRAQLTTTTRERPLAPVVRKVGVMGMEPTFRGTRVPPRPVFAGLAGDHTLAEILADDYPAVPRALAESAIMRACVLLERDAPLDLSEGP